MNNSNYTILIVDDERDILEFMEYNLKQEGYNVIKAENGNDAILKAKENKPHLVLLDVMMPGITGIEVCAKMRQKNKFNKTIIAFLTALNNEETQIAGLTAGGDDYISKPIKPKLLMSKVASLLRRVKDQSIDETLHMGDIIIDRAAYSVKKNGNKIKLPRKEFELLYLLASKPDKVFTREKIFDKVWGDDIIVGHRTIDVHIRKLREKVGSNIIETVKGIGYKWVYE